MTRILGIETSCDETSAAVLEGSGNDVVQRSLVILSQDIHKVFGGVVPEIASRAHLTAIVPVVERALLEADVPSDGSGASANLEAFDAIAVTNAPGLVGALLVGMSYGKALAFANGIPVIGVHHMEGHLFSASLEHPDAVPPFTALLVSGGHTLLLDVPEWGSYRLLGATRDDAAGEAFDKVAKLLGLPYPGGPHVERLAREGESGRYRFTRPMLRSDQRPGDPDYYDMSFSGLKTAVLNAARGADSDSDRASIARAFQDSLVETLVEKTWRAAREYGRKRVVLGGGVAGNRTLVNALRERVAEGGAEVYAPSTRLAADNAAMIARAGLYRFEQGERSAAALNAYASAPIPGLVAA
ncbi:MAG TPA: tRNA (adenosine(37)-N6)-threonylcarbamoyltransferase complex transferase subunit TsaD [Gemmatimonadaceae bacterium]|nr:tRNA (adenosine(37)-N6)-threonylcarbamoyltransferase complex transferase subunit TsaD [Gemmatimonadaceae bacterium]